MATKLTILGTSAAVPANKRNLSAQLLEVDGYSLLFDCGEATQFQLKRYKLNFFKIEYILISHLHGDHFFGLPGLISTMNMMGRTTKLTIFSPPGLEKAIAPLFNISKMKLEFEIDFEEINNIQSKKEIIKNDLFSIYAFPLNHTVEAYGYICNRHSDKLNIDKGFIEQNPNIPTKWFSRIKNGEDYIDGNGKVFKNEDITIIPQKDVSFAYCTDTGFYEPIVENVRNVDLLYHESTYLNCDEAKADLRKHSTSRNAATIAKMAGAKRLLLGHFSGRYKDAAQFKIEAEEVFSKEVILATEGLQIII